MFEKGGVPMFDIHRPNVCEIPRGKLKKGITWAQAERQLCATYGERLPIGVFSKAANASSGVLEDVMFFVSRR